MKVGLEVLRRYVQLPTEVTAVRELLDDVGVEVKRTESGEYGTVLTVELLANRGDHYCYEGIAREVSGRTGDPVSLPPTARLEVGASPHPVRIETSLCPRYAATLLERTGAGQLSRDEQLPLHCGGLGSISAPVDATNLANLELGQPTHAFDLDTLEGPITVRLSRQGEKAWPLFTEEPVELPEGLVVIADDAKILAIAGVIGCEESKTTETTTRVLLESAAFDPVAVRKASRHLGIHTDSSARFERGSDFARVLKGAGRVVHLMERAGWSRVGTTGDHGEWADPVRAVPLDIVAAASFLEYPLTAEEVRDRLERYGFEVSDVWPDWPEDWAVDPKSVPSRDKQRHTVLVRVPPARLWDVEFPADLMEELAKSIGYNDTPIQLPPVDRGEVPTPREIVRTRVEEVLLGNGFYEVITNGFHGRDLRDKLGITEGHDLYAHVETVNALERGYSLLKNNGFAQAVEAVAANLRRRETEIRAYEWTRTFQPDATARNGLCREHHLVWGVACGHDADPNWSHNRRSADVHFLVGLIAEIATELSLPLEVVTTDLDPRFDGLLHPGRRADIRLHGERVGVLGEVHPAVRQSFKLGKVRPVYFELSEDRLQAPAEEQPYVEPSVHQDMVRSLAFTLPRGVYAAEVAAVLRDQAPTWYLGADVVDRFDHDRDGQAVSTLTYELRFAQGADGRSADEVNATCEFLIQAVQQRLGDRGVALRG